jgi:hypothetical protein
MTSTKGIRALRGILIGIVATIAGATAAGTEVDPAWLVNYDGPGTSDDLASNVWVGPQGTVFVAGRTYNGVDSYRAYALGLAPDGTTMWERILSPRIHHDGPHALVGDLAGDLLLTAPTLDGNSWRFGLWKLDGQTGAVLWEKPFETFGGCLVQSYASAPVAIGPDNNVHVVGCGLTTTKYAPDGTELWQRMPGADPQDPYGADIVVDDMGRVYTVGVSFDFDLAGFPVVAYDADGTELWSDFLVGPIGSVLGPAWITLDPDGNVVVAAVPETTCGLFGLMLTKYDPSGTALWSLQYPNNPCRSFTTVGVEALPTGEIAVAGTLAFDVGVVVFDADGGFLWEETYDGPLGSSDQAFAVTSDDDGTIYVIGEELLAAQDRDFVTLAYDRFGERRWKTSYGAPSDGNDRPQGLAIGPCGRVYAVGYGWYPGTGNDGIILGYTQVGPGDVDRDGDTNMSDLAIVQQNYSMTNATWTDGDVSENGAVDFADVEIVMLELSGGCY